MEVGFTSYVVTVDYATFKFDSALDAVRFANTALTHGRDGVRVNIEFVWMKKENKETEEK